MPVKYVVLNQGSLVLELWTGRGWSLTTKSSHMSAST